MEPQWERLGEYVLARRKSKGWSQDDVTARGGPSDSLQTEIEALRWKPQRAVRGTLIKIDDGLEWEVGSASRILAGGEPVDLHAPADAAPKMPAHDHRLGGARHLLDHMWGVAEQFAEDLLVACTPTTALGESAGRLIGLYGGYLADQLIAQDLLAEDRDRLLAELYRRRDAVAKRIDETVETPTAQEMSAHDAHEGTGLTRVEAQLTRKRMGVEKPGDSDQKGS